MADPDVELIAPPETRPRIRQGCGGFSHRIGDMGKWVHRTTDRDLVAMTATCAACGPVRLVRNSRGAYVCHIGRNSQRGRPRNTGNRHPHIKRKRIEEQDGKCAICLKDLADKQMNLDHCHETGTLRGVLCNRCNTGLGCFEDSIEVLRQAAAYLEKFRRT